MRIIRRPNNLAWANRHYLDLDMYRKFEVRKTKDSYPIDVIIFDFG